MGARKIISGNYRNDTPLFRMMLPFIAGIIFQLNFPTRIADDFIFFSLLLIFIAGHTLIKNVKTHYKIRWITGMVFLSTFFLSGIIVTSIQTEISNPNHFQYHIAKDQIYFARLINPLSERPNSYKTSIEILEIKSGQKSLKVAGKVMVYFKKDSLTSRLKYGDLLCFGKDPVFVEGPKNPGEFDFKQFLANHQIYHQVYLAGSDWKKLNKNEGNPVIYFAYQARAFFCDILRTYIPDKRSFAVASALVIGYVDEVDKELINAYASAGALHVLSVSGMHVGLIYQGLFLLLGFMNKNKMGRHCFHAFLLSFIWFYALLTGFSPSVARSAVMLSVVLTGRWFDGTTNVFNTLVVTAFALLIYNPFYITDVGFQLSFLAVWGIVYFHPKIFQLYEPSGRAMHWVWELTSISLAAQLMTFPLGLLYFHQFPNLFMLTNLVVIPLSGIIIYACLALLAVSPVAVVCHVISTITTFLLKVLNESVLFVEQVPGSVCNRIYISNFEVGTIYFVLACATIYILCKKPVYLFSGLLGVILIITVELYDKFEKINQVQFIVYNIPGKHAMDLVSGDRHIFVSDSVLANNKTTMLFHIIPHWWNLGLTEDRYLNTGHMPGVGWNTPADCWVKNHFICFEGKKIVVADKNFMVKAQTDEPVVLRRLKIDYLILSGNAVKHLKDIVSVFDCKEIIIDSSNSKYYAERWLGEAKALNIKCYSVLDEGAFVERIR